jgi:tape measure domain-containing protein
MTTETLTIVLKADGTGLTGTIRTSTNDVRQFGLAVDQAAKQADSAGASNRKLARDIDQVDRSAKKTGGTLREMATGLNTVKGTLATLGITFVAREMLGAGLAMDRFERSTAAAVGSQTLARRELAFVRQEAQRLGIYFPTLAQGYAGLAASTRGTNLEGRQTREIFLGIVEAGRAMNLTQEQIMGTLTAVSQIAGKGTVSMEELRQQLGDRLPGAMQIAARSMGYTVAEFVKLVSEGKVLSDEFLPKFARELRAASAAGVELARNSPAAQFDRLRTVIFELGVEIARGGVMDTLATGAAALTTVLNVLVSSGSIQTITGLLVKLALAGAVFYAGGLLQRGLVALMTTFALMRAPVAAFGVGLAASAAGAQGLTVRMVAAGLATRGLGAAMAFVQANPIMLAVTAVTLLVTWLYTSREAARAAAEELRQGFRTAKQALDEFNNAPSLQGVFTLADAKIGQSIDNIREKLVELRKEQEALSDRNARMVARFGFADPSIARDLAANAAEVERYRIQLEALERGQDRAASSVSGLISQMVGVERVTPAVRAELDAISREWVSSGQTLEEIMPKYQGVIEKHLGVADAARLSATEIANFGASLDQVGKDMEGYQKQLASIQVRMAEIRGGVGEATKIRVGQDINAAARAAGGGDREKGLQILRDTGQLAEYGRMLQQLTTQSQDLERAEQAQANARKASTAATRDAKREAKDHAKELKQQLEAQIRYSLEAERATAALKGGLQVAQVEHRQRIAELTAELEKNNIKQADFNALKAEAEDQLKRTTESMRRDADVIGRVRADYGQMVSLSRLSYEQRRVEEQVIRAVAEAEEEANRQRDESIRLTPQQIASLREFVRVSEDVIRANEEQVRISEDLKNAWVNAAQSASRAFGDWFASGLKDGKSFARSMKDIFKRLVSDIVSMLADRAIVQPFMNWISGMMSGGFGQSGGGGFWGSLISAFTGGGGRGGAGGGGGFWGQMLSMFTGGGGSGGAGTGWLSQLGSLFGIGGSGAALLGGGGATSAAGFGTSFGSGLYGGASGAGGAGAGGAGALGAVAWVAAIVAGMYMNSQWWKEGWRAEGQKSDLVKYPASKGLIFASVDHAAVMGAHNLLNALGVNDKWAAILSGSAGIARAFGHKKPEVKGTGITGSIGFGGFSGSSYADIKQRGGWFRSDRRWTQYGAIDTSVDNAFDSVAVSMRERSLDLAKQLGVDITAALDAVKIDLGKIQLDGDPEKARAQIEAQLEKAVEQLAAAGLKALGFGRLLDDGFRASEQMAALSVAIGLVSGSAEDLGRSLTALEKENIARAVEYFQGEALRSGTSLGDTVTRITGLLGDYSGLISGVDTQIRTRDLSQYQQAQLQIELQYREQIRQANDLAKALGLSGARSEDLAKIEQLRALRMADLQQQMEAQRNGFLLDLSMSELSPLRDEQKLGEAMTALRAAVTAGDMQRVQQLSQQALGFGRNLYASGADYNALYDEVTGLVRQVSNQELAGFTESQLDEIADLLTDLPTRIAREMFALMYRPLTVLPPPPPPPPPNGTGGNGGNGNNGGGGGPTDWRDVVRLLTKIAADSGRTADATSQSADAARERQLREMLGSHAV